MLRRRVAIPQGRINKDACPDLTGMLRESGIAWSVIGGESGSKKESRLMTLDDAQYLFTSSEDAGCCGPT